MAGSTSRRSSVSSRSGLILDLPVVARQHQLETQLALVSSAIHSLGIWGFSMDRPRIKIIIDSRRISPPFSLQNYSQDSQSKPPDGLLAGSPLSYVCGSITYLLTHLASYRRAYPTTRPGPPCRCLLTPSSNVLCFDTPRPLRHP